MIELIGQNNNPTNHRHGVHYVICLIEVWKNDNVLDYEYNSNVLRLTECEYLKCDESYSQILDTLELKLPKGSVVRKTIANENESADAYYDINISKEDYGVVQITKNNAVKTSVADFSPGSRIRVYVGYTEDKSVADLGRIDMHPANTIFGGGENILQKYKNAMGYSPIFDGFITTCSDKTPITISAESIASVMKKLSVVPTGPIPSMSLNNILERIGFTEKTGFEIHGATKGALENINLPVTFKSGMSVYDFFMNYLKQYDLYSKIVRDENAKKYYLRIGYSFQSGVIGNNDDQPCIYDGKQAYVVYSDYNVAQDNLTFENIDLYYLVIKCNATIIESAGKRTSYSVCVRMSPNADKNTNNKLSISFFDEKATTKEERKTLKKTGSVKTDTSTYKVIDRTYPVAIPRKKFNEDDIKAWGIVQLLDSMKNGVSGSLNLFGDYHLKGGDIIMYIDRRYESRNGLYLIEKVSTSLSVDGLRQNISIPYKLAEEDSNTKEAVNKYKQIIEDSKK